MQLYLHVRLIVAKSNLSAFGTAVQAFLKSRLLQDKFGWKLIAGLEVLDEDYPNAPVRRPQLIVNKKTETAFINIWKLPAEAKSADISSIMLALSEEPTYVELDNQVLDESQDVVYRANDPIITPDEALVKALMDPKRRHIGISRHYLWRKQLAEFVLNFGTLAPDWEAQTGYVCGGTYQNITGLLNEFWNVWGTDEQSIASLRKKFFALTEQAPAFPGDDYRKSIGFPDDGPDDGLVIAKPAFYWSYE